MARKLVDPAEERLDFLLLLKYLIDYDGEAIDMPAARRMTNEQLEDLLGEYRHVRSSIAWLCRPDYPPAQLLPMAKMEVAT